MTARNVEQSGRPAGRMQIVLGADEGYALPLAVAIHSALSRLNPDASLDLHCIDCGLSEESKLHITRLASSTRDHVDIHFHELRLDRFASLPKIHWGTVATYMTLTVDRLIDAPRALFIDADTLVRSDLSQLWQLTPDPDQPLSAVTDYGFPTLRDLFGDQGCAEIGLEGDRPYLNSGVMNMNLDLFRREDISSRALELASRYASFMHFTDQDALNMAVAGNWRVLSSRWNVLVGSIDRLLDRSEPHDRESLRADLQDGHILHFSGPMKPWKPGYTRFGKKEYLQAIVDSNWLESRAERLRYDLRRRAKSPYAIMKRRAISTMWPLVKRMKALRES